MGKRDTESLRQLNFLEPLDLQLKEPIGNKKLIPYGILEEQSDFRVHVGYKTQFIFVFPTISGRDAVKQAMLRNYSAKEVKLDGKITTARGYPIPIGMIAKLKEIVIPQHIHRKYPIGRFESTTAKGQKAVQITVEMLRAELIPIPIAINIDNTESVQIQGTDILINSYLRLQVKCDYDAGDKKYGGTGNVFLQTEECNPYKFV